jgi:hypothetical protein
MYEIQSLGVTPPTRPRLSDSGNEDEMEESN